ncbi:hypothetical protein VTK73DRAFT_9687 [Phialemonium thermophilum]|uniref:Uncharacterized protein n=1 Tax=Phialemonium thermophilum TaxID=223376 RepID=A0ABR3W173_9PEZI
MREAIEGFRALERTKSVWPRTCRRQQGRCWREGPALPTRMYYSSTDGKENALPVRAQVEQATRRPGPPASPAKARLAPIRYDVCTVEHSIASTLPRLERRAYISLIHACFPITYKTISLEPLLRRLLPSSPSSSFTEQTPSDPSCPRTRPCRPCPRWRRGS